MLAVVESQVAFQSPFVERLNSVCVYIYIYVCVCVCVHMHICYSSKYCFIFSSILTDKSKVPSWCSMGRGVGYAGHVSVTSSGRLCQDWNSQSPHPHAVYSGTAIHGALNQCRNPEGRGTRPWCYTIDRNVRWEYCDDVPKCGE